MSSKTTHTLAGLATGGLLAYFSKSDATHTVLLLLGAHMGASAPDWAEVSTWITTRHWFSANESHRLSLIPHRTITHTLSLWVLATMYSLYLLYFGAHQYTSLLAFAFCMSALTHLLLDIRTPMGIPLLPFGKRYRFHGFQFEVARTIQQRHGW